MGQGPSPVGAGRPEVNLLILPQYRYPTNHAVVSTVYETLLPAHGHVVHMVRPMAGVQGPQRMDAPWPGGSMVVYPYEATAGRIQNLVRGLRRSRWLARALRLLEHVPLDAIIVRNDLPSAVAAVTLARRRGIPFLYQLSSPDAEFMISHGREVGGLAGVYPRLRGRYGLAVRRWVSRRATAVLAISDSMRAHLVADDGLDPQKVFSFPMGVEDRPVATLEDVETLRRSLNLPAGRTIVYSGTIDPVRRPEWMLDVFDRVRTRVSGAAFLVITYDSDDCRTHFAEEARRRGADVRVVGPIPFREVSRYLLCADVVMAAYPPMMEHKISSPTKSVEGMAVGLPVVGSAEVDEHAAIFAASGGGVLVDWDRDRFADALVALLQDPERRRHMGEQGRKWVLEHRTYSHLTRYLERILEAARTPAALGALPHVP
jgi:glycosyltransferase involved in cell wall biosynthesis